MLTNKELKFLQSLHNKKERQQLGQFLVDNPKVIIEQLKNPHLKKLYVSEDFLHSAKRFYAPIKPVVISQAELKKISPSQTPQGVVAVFAIPPVLDFDWKDKQILLLDGVQDPGNVGTIIRTADWFGISSVVLGKNCADLYNPKTVAASMGSLFHTQVYQIDDLLALVLDLKKHKYQIIASTLTGKSVKLRSSKVALLIGSEAHGLAPDLLALADLQYKIKGYGQAESLNAAVACGIMLYELNIK